jgi:hypothetical protein
LARHTNLRRDTTLIRATTLTTTSNMVGVAHIPRSRDPTLASSPQLSSEAGAGGTNAMGTRSGEKEKIKPLVVVAAAVAAIGGELLHQHAKICLCVCVRSLSKLNGVQRYTANLASPCHFSVKAISYCSWCMMRFNYAITIPILSSPFTTLFMFALTQQVSSLAMTLEAAVAPSPCMASVSRW